MAAVPYLTTDTLISSIKRKISLPIDQATFTEEDIIAFINEELMISQVPSVMEYHESYFVHIVTVPLRDNVRKYQIPNRAIGMKLNDLTYVDTQDNLYEMTRVNDGDKAYFQSNLGSTNTIHKFYLEGNYVVLTPADTTNFQPIGSLEFSIFLRPNQLVHDNRAAFITSFNRKVTIVNASIVAGNTITILDEVFTAVAGSPGANEFQIGGTSIITATNLTNAINTNGIVVATNGSPNTDTVILRFETKFDAVEEIATSNETAIVINELLTIEFESMPGNIQNGLKIDFLQTNPGHQIYSFDVQLGSNSITGTSIDFDELNVPDDIIVGDYIALSHESIIPNLPPELHNVLAERTCARILSAIGDQQGLAATMQHIQEMEKRQGTLIDNRVENAPQKVLNRSSLLRYGKMGWRRRI